MRCYSRVTRVPSLEKRDFSADRDEKVKRVERSVNKMSAPYLSVSREHSSRGRASGTIFRYSINGSPLHRPRLKKKKKKKRERSQRDVVTTVPTILHAPATRMAAATPTADLLSLSGGMHDAARAFDLCRIARSTRLLNLFKSHGARSHRRPKTDASNGQRQRQRKREGGGDIRGI